MKNDTQKMSANTVPKFRELGDLLKELRILSNLSQPEVAARVEVTQQTVSRWEAGLSRPQSKVIGKLAAVLQSDADTLSSVAGYSIKKVVAANAQPFPVDALSWDDFERFCCYFLERLHPSAKVHQLGSPGDDQGGSDILVSFKDGNRFSFQCKRVAQFGPNDVTDAVEKHSEVAQRKVFVLSRNASVGARKTIDEYPDWEIWDKEDLSRKIRSLPKEEQIRLTDVFFRGQREALLGETEPGPWQTAEEFFRPFVARRSPYHHAWQLVGRQGLVKELVEELRSKEPPFKIVVGPGGSGKTRILKEVLEVLESAHKGLTAIRFAAIHGEITTRSLQDMGSRRKILVIDDAHERSDLEAVFSFAAVPENNTVVILSTRPYGLQFIKGVASRYGLSNSSTFEIQPFTLEEAESLSRQVLSEYGGDINTAKVIAKMTLDCPLATVFASFVVAKEGTHPRLAINDPQFQHTLMDRFRKVMTGFIGSGSDAQIIEKVMRVIAIVQPFNGEDSSIYQVFENVEQVGTVEGKRIIRLLSDAGLLIKRSGKHRLSPDMLADLIIEENCIGRDGSSTGYAERVFDHCGSPLLKNVLINTGKLDWRLSARDGKSLELLDGVWRKLQPSWKYSDPHIGAVAAVAYYQPERALAFADELIRGSKFTDQLPNVIRNAAYSFEYLKHCCESLWQIGKDDSRELNQHPEHAIRILQELCEFDLYQPLDYNAAVVAFGIELALNSENFNFAYDPFHILEGILETQVNRAVSDKGGFYLERYNVPPKAVTGLRNRVVDCALELLGHRDISIALRSVRILREAIRYPVSRAFDEEWTSHFEDVLGKIEKMIKNLNLEPVIYADLVKAVEWHQKHGPKKTAGIAKRIIQRQPSDVEYRMFCALSEGWELLNDSDEQKKSLDKLISDVFQEFKKPIRVAEFLETQLHNLSEASRQSQGAGVLVHLLVDKEIELAKCICDFALANPSSELSLVSDIALGKLLRDNRKAAVKQIEKFMQSKSKRLKIAVGLAYWRAVRVSTELSGSDLKIAESLLSSDEMDVASSSFNLLRILSLQCASVQQARLILDLARHVDLVRHTEIVGNLFGIIASKEVLPYLDEKDIDHFLEKLLHLQELDDYWIQTFLSHVSKSDSVRAAEFLMKRVEMAIEHDDWRYKPCSRYGPEQVRMQFRESADCNYLMKIMLQWIKSRTDREFRRYSCEVFYWMFKPFDKFVLEFIENVAGEGTKEDMSILCQILKEVSGDLVFREHEFVHRFLGKCAQHGSDFLEEAISSLYIASTSGMKSGKFGEPFDQDLKIAKESEEILSKLNRFSPSYKLYKCLQEHSEHEIQRAHRELEDEFED